MAASVRMCLIKIRRAEAAVLFIGDRGDQQIAAQFRAGIDEGFHRGHLRGEDPFHVVAAAAEHFSVADGGGKGLLHAFDADGVVMRVEHQALSAAGAWEGCRPR